MAAFFLQKLISNEAIEYTMYEIVFLIGLCVLLGTSIYIGASVIPNMYTHVSNQTTPYSKTSIPMGKGMILPNTPLLPIEIVSELKLTPVRTTQKITFVQIHPIKKLTSKWNHKKG